MATQDQKIDSNKSCGYNATLDVVKYIMAILVIGIHTEPFGFNFWFDKGFGIFTRLCVPFFFVASGFLYWSKDKSAFLYLKRIFILYAVWSFVYFPFDYNWLHDASIGSIIKRFCWDGNEHALWYLCGTIIGFIITYVLLKVLKPKVVFIVSIFFLLIGCLKSTWSPLLQYLFSIDVYDWLGSRNGLFYAFPYVALGMIIAKKSKEKGFTSLKFSSVGFCISAFLLIIESFVFVIHFKTNSTILWLSVMPMTYFFFAIINNIHIALDKETACIFRKMSTLVYVSQYLFIPSLSKVFSTYMLFIFTTVLATCFAYLIIRLSEFKKLSYLKYLY